MFFHSLRERLPRGLRDRFPGAHEQHVAPPEMRPEIAFDQRTDSDIQALYARLRPDQRTAIGGEFVRLFRLSGDPAAQRFTHPIEGMLTADQVAEMHIFARDHLPGVLEQVRMHPVTQEALAHPGLESAPVETEESVIQEPIEVEDLSTIAEPDVGRDSLFMAETGTQLMGGPLSPSHVTHTPEGETGDGSDILESVQREGPLTNPADHGG